MPEKYLTPNLWLFDHFHHAKAEVLKQLYILIPNTCISPASNLAYNKVYSLGHGGSLQSWSLAVLRTVQVDFITIQLWWTWPSLVCGPRTPGNSGSCGEEPSISLGVDSSSSSSSASFGCSGGVRSSLFPEGIAVAISIWKRSRISSGNLLNHPLWQLHKFKMYPSLPQEVAGVLKLNKVGRLLAWEGPCGSSYCYCF